MFRYRDTTYETLDINADGYVQITPPSGLGTIENASILTWYSGQPYNVSANGMYVLGKPSSTIKGLIIRFYY